MSTPTNNLFEKLKVNKLPTLPHILTEILDACQSATAGFDKMSKIIRHDPVMTSKLVAIANSASYFQRQKITSIERALVLIGTEQIKTIAITVAVQQFFSEFNARQTEYLKSFWSSSLRCALLAKAFATLTRFPRPEHAYLTGLLHNIGDLALRTNFPSEYADLDNLLGASDSELTELENAAILTNHCEFGGWLIERWGLGEFTAAAVKYHHEPLSLLLDAHHLVKIIYISSHLGAADEASQKLGTEAAGKLFSLTPDLVSEIDQKIQQEYASIAKSLQIELVSAPSETRRIQQQDEKKQVRLAQEVRNIGLLHSAKEHLDATRTLSEFYRALEETAFMLFGYNATKLFLVDDDLQILSYLDYANTGLQEAANDDSMQLEVPLQEKRSMMATAIITNEPVTSAQWESNQGKLTVIDQHVLTLLQTPHMICVPIHKTGTAGLSPPKHLGLLALGSALAPTHSAQSIRMLRVFADNAGLRFNQIQAELSDNDLSREEQQLRLREISHEVGNPLTIIRNYLDILSGRLDDQEEAQQDLSIIREEIDRVGEILLRLSDSNMQHHEGSGADVNQEISSLVSLFSSSIFLTHEIQCNLDLDKKLKRQAVSRSYIKQILVNLIKNAAEAMPKGGEVTISTNHQVNVNGRRYTEIVIHDNGPGLAEASLPSLFEAGGSTKGDKHSGLGLSICKTLVDELKGTISCRNTRRGAQFQVLLPAKDMEVSDGSQSGQSY